MSTPPRGNASARLFSALLATLGLFLIVCAFILASAVPVSSAKEVIVNMQNFSFIPTGQTLQANVTVDVGDTVTWVYAESLQGVVPTGCALLNGPNPVPICPGHSTTSVVAGQWDSKIFGKAVPPSQVQYANNRYSVRFDAPGTFAYKCTEHETLQFPFNSLQGMKASVIVQGTGPPGGTGGPSPTTSPLPATGSPSTQMTLMGLGLLYVSWRLRRSLLTADLEGA